MGKTRLTNADREAIRNAVLEHRFAPLEAQHAAQGHALAIKARAKAYSDFIKVMDAAPEGAFPTDSHPDVNVGGKRITLHAAGPLRVFDKHTRYSASLLSIPDTEKLGAEILAWAEAGEASKAERRHLASVITGTLAAFNSFDDLQKGWPEADKFILARWQSRPDYTANVPAVAIRDLSAALDLPPEAEAA